MTPNEIEYLATSGDSAILTQTRVTEHVVLISLDTVLSIDNMTDPIDSVNNKNIDFYATNGVYQYKNVTTVTCHGGRARLARG